MSACNRNVKFEVTQSLQPPLVETKSIVTLPEASVAINTPQASKQVGLLKEFQNKYEPEEQVFKVDLAETQEIVGEKGTRITIPQGSIVSAYDQVEIHLDEAYSTIDMLKYQLTTTSNGQPIVSKGMIKLTCNDPLATINPNIPIEVKFPSNDKETACDYFIGKESKDGSVNWIPQNQVTKTNNNSVAKPQLVYTNNNGMYLKNNIDNITSLGYNNVVSNTNSSVNEMNSTINAIDIHSAFCLDTSKVFRNMDDLGYFPKSIYDKVILRADVEVSGKLTNVQIIKGIHKYIDSTIYNMVIKSYPWVPMRQAKNNFNRSTININVKIISDSRGKLHAYKPFVMTSTLKRQEIYKEWLEVMNIYLIQSNEEAEVSRTNMGSIVSYNFNIKQFGWINCDYFPRNTPNVQFTFKHKDDLALRHMIVYKNEKRILRVDGYSLINVANKPFDIIVLKEKDNKFYFSITPSDKIKQQELIENQIEYSMEDFEKYIKTNYN